MSKIDLSQAKIGDKFRTRDGIVVKYVDYDKFLDLYFVSENDKPYPVQKDGRFLCERESFSDLIEQVLDKTLDIIERDMRINREMEEIVEVAKKEKQELQRRQEVVELAEKMYIMFENEILKYDLSRNGSSTHSSEKLKERAIIRAASFIDRKQKYLKDGKLC